MLSKHAGIWKGDLGRMKATKYQIELKEGVLPTRPFNRIPFGLTNALASFQRALDVIFTRYKWETRLVYLDNVIVFFKNTEEHLEHVHLVLTALHKAGISLKIDKCHFFARKIKYLGHIVCPGTIVVDEAAKNSLRQANPPTTLTQLRSFFGFLHVYSQFIP
eukprot:IDg7336t1